MGYLLVALSGLAYGCRMIVTKKYQDRNGSALGAAFLFSSCFGFLTALGFFFINGCKIEFTWFSFLCGSLVAAEEVLATVVANQAMSRGNVAIYTMFVMSGGLIIPFFYGFIFLHEIPSVFDIIGVSVVFLSFLIPAIFYPRKKKDVDANPEEKKKSKKSKLFFLLCLCAFLLEGFGTVVIKYHQISSAEKVSTFGFSILDFGMIFVLSSIAFGFNCIKHKPYNEAVNPPRLYFSGWLALWAGLYATIGGVATFLNMDCAKVLAATRQSPLLAGCTIVFSAILGRILLKQKLSWQSLLQIGMCVAGAILVLF